jgi:hypothetical protein
MEAMIAGSRGRSKHSTPIGKTAQESDHDSRMIPPGPGAASSVLLLGSPGPSLKSLSLDAGLGAIMMIAGLGARALQSRAAGGFWPQAEAIAAQQGHFPGPGPASCHSASLPPRDKTPAASRNPPPCRCDSELTGTGSLKLRLTAHCLSGTAVTRRTGNAAQWASDAAAPSHGMPRTRPGFNVAAHLPVSPDRADPARERKRPRPAGAASSTPSRVSHAQ